MSSDKNSCSNAYSITSTKTKHTGSWLRFVEHRYHHKDGHEIVYESVDRLRCPLGQAAAVIVVPRFGDCLLLVKQFRAPVNAWVVEFPAGLTEPGEPAEAAALRELQEETGFTGSVVSVSTRCAAECSLTSADEVYVAVTCHHHLAAGGPANEADEDIEVLTVPVGELRQRLAALAAEGCLVCTRLQAFAMGLGWTS